MISINESPSAGAECPARQRLCAAITCSNSSSLIVPRPTSKRVPTTARTMFRKNRLAVISK